MATYNKVILMGNLTRDPQVRYTPSGAAVAEIGLALNRYWTDKQTNSRREETTFVDVTLWSRDAEVAGEYLAKGRSVLIEGRLQLDTWDGSAWVSLARLGSDPAFSMCAGRSPLRTCGRARMASIAD